MVLVATSQTVQYNFKNLHSIFFFPSHIFSKDIAHVLNLQTTHTSEHRAIYDVATNGLWIQENILIPARAAHNIQQYLWNLIYIYLALLLNSSGFSLTAVQEIKGGEGPIKTITSKIFYSTQVIYWGLALLNSLE